MFKIQVPSLAVTKDEPKVAVVGFEVPVPTGKGSSRTASSQVPLNMEVVPIPWHRQSDSDRDGTNSVDQNVIGSDQNTGPTGSSW